MNAADIKVVAEAAEYLETLEKAAAQLRVCDEDRGVSVRVVRRAHVQYHELKNTDESQTFTVPAIPMIKLVAEEITRVKQQMRDKGITFPT